MKTIVTRFLGLAALVVILRFLTEILYQYQWYFPADFRKADFLIGREAFFNGAYRIAFYGHIVCGPIVMIIALYLLWSGRRGLSNTIHRQLGKVQFILVVALLGPTGLVMATRAHTGLVAGVGFGILSVLTVTSAVQAVWHIKQRRVAEHSLWAKRLVILLLSPIVLRLINRVGNGMGFDPLATYQFSAWANWLAPLIAFELWMRVLAFKNSKRTVTPHRDESHNPQIEKAL